MFSKSKLFYCESDAVFQPLKLFPPSDVPKSRVVTVVTPRVCETAGGGPPLPADVSSKAVPPPALLPFSPAIPPAPAADEDPASALDSPPLMASTRPRSASDAESIIVKGHVISSISIQSIEIGD